MARYILFHARLTGSQIALDALKQCKAPFRLIEVDYEKTSKLREPRLLRVNPLSRLPTLVLPTGEILTESGAILLHLAARFPRAGLVPPVRSREYARFLRLLFIITGEIYPCFTFRDDPSEWVRAKSAREDYAARVYRHRNELWLYLESLLSARGPWALGTRFSAIDIYLARMTHWGPGWEWFEKHTTRIQRVALKARERLGPR